MFGCEHVTACTADILRSAIEYNFGKGLNLSTVTFDYLIIVQGLLPFLKRKDSQYMFGRCVLHDLTLQLKISKL